MTTKRICAIVVLLSMLMTTGITQSFSQGKMEKKEKREMMKEKRGDFKKMEIPDLTEQQEAAIKSLRLSFVKETKEMRNQLKEYKAHLNTLKSAENANISEINNQIELINKSRTAVEKKQAALEQEIRKLLKEEQRLYFDEHRGHGEMNNDRSEHTGDPRGNE